MLGTNLAGKAQDIASDDNDTEDSNISVEKIGFSQAGLDLNGLQSISSRLDCRHRVEGVDAGAMVGDDAARAPNGPRAARRAPGPRPT